MMKFAHVLRVAEAVRSECLLRGAANVDAEAVATQLWNVHVATCECCEKRAAIGLNGGTRVCAACCPYGHVSPL